MIFLFITLIRAVPVSQLYTAAPCRSLAVDDAVPWEHNAPTRCDDRRGGDAVNGVTGTSPPCPHPCKRGR